ncbi:MAG: sulfatase [Verrucomicrobiota bacterium]
MIVPRNYIQLLIVLYLLLFCGMALPLAYGAQQKPNIVLILADDLGYQDLGYTGATEFKTPHIDKLAATGMVFTQGYANHSFCAPTRAALMAGRYQQRFGFETNTPSSAAFKRGGLPKSEVTVATRLKQVGYRTGLVGKWHLGYRSDYHPLNRGFDYFFGHLGGGHDYFRVDSTEFEQSYLHPLIDNKSYSNVEGYLTHQFTDRALGFIDENKEKPFFLFVSYNAPHAPWQAPQETIDSLSNIEDPHRRAYAAMIVEMDRDIGRIVSHLAKHDLSENTLIFFLSDNGGDKPGKVASNAPFRAGKGELYEGGIHVPFIANWPGKIKPGTFDYPVTGIDITQTAVEMAGGDTNLMEGENLLPYATGEKTDAPHDYIFFRRRGGVVWAVIDKEGKKLIVPSWESKQAELYDLKQDVSESNDLFVSEPEEAARLQKAFNDWNAKNAPYGEIDFINTYQVPMEKLNEGNL